MISLRFEVKDTGIGVPLEARNRIFQAFSQADGSTTRKYGGTGLGLTIVKRLAEMMDGEVGIESEPGQGSSFWFTASFQRIEDPILPHKYIAAELPDSRFQMSD
jgi:signal transduction histidine kinase